MSAPAKSNEGKISNESTSMNSLEKIDDVSNNNNNNNDINSSHKNNLKPGVLSFYSGTSVFITGGTGFVGKALIEKILRSCDIDTLYILMRTKRGTGVDQRCENLIKNKIFENIRDKNPEVLTKIRAIKGDVSLPNLGLSSKDEEELTSKVNIVIHSAATVRFTDPLSVAFALNTKGTKSIADLCCKCKNFKSLVYVSTAYCNSYKSVIEEKVYPNSCDPETILECSSVISPEALDSIWTHVQGPHPNTYTFTKNLAENVIKNQFGKIPVTIVRPSIITASYNEPFPGWIDSFGGATFAHMEIYRGAFKTTYFPSDDIIMDYIPIDIVVNTCITAAWHHTTLNSNDLIVYNCTSGQMNPASWKYFNLKAVEYGRNVPTKYAVSYPNFETTDNHFIHQFWQIISHYLPTSILDVWLKLCGKKAFTYKLVRRVETGLVNGSFCGFHNWTFTNNNLKSLTKALNETGEDVYFPCDIKQLNLSTYAENIFLGIRKYLLKDSIDSLPQAKKKVQRLSYIYYFFYIFTGYGLLLFLMDKLKMLKMLR